MEEHQKIDEDIILHAHQMVKHDKRFWNLPWRQLFSILPSLARIHSPVPPLGPSNDELHFHQIARYPHYVVLAARCQNPSPHQIGC